MTRENAGGRAWIDGESLDWIGDDILAKEIDDETFHIGQSYEKKAAKVLECRKCGGREFNVGQGNFFTVIRCVKCEWELCVHDG